MNISPASCLAACPPSLLARLRTCSVPRPAACFWRFQRFLVRVRRSSKSTSANARKRWGCAGRDAAKRRQRSMLRAPPSEAWGFLLLALPSGCWLPARHGPPWLSARPLGLSSQCSYGRSDDGYGRGDTPPGRTFESDVRLGGRPLRIGAEIWDASPDERRGRYRIRCRNATKGLTLCRTRCGPPIAHRRRPRIRRRLKTSETTDHSYRMGLSHRIRRRRHAILGGEVDLSFRSQVNSKSYAHD